MLESGKVLRFVLEQIIWKLVGEFDLGIGLVVKPRIGLVNVVRELSVGVTENDVLRLLRMLLQGFVW